MKICKLIVLLLVSATAIAQSDSTKKITFSGYGELYYSYDFSNPEFCEKPTFVYNHKIHNQLSANLIRVKANYVEKNVRGNLGIMVGDYAQYNLESEPTWVQFVYEANIGLKLSKNKDIWFDAGIMPSHIGFESAVSADCWTLTRSILAENSPYYETGAKVSYTNKNQNLNLSFLVLNGWQVVRKQNFSKTPSFGVQINYKPKENLILNYSNFIGNIFYDASIRDFILRRFHNFYLQYTSPKNIGIIAGFDLGREDRFPSNPAIWYSPVVIIRRNLSNKTRIALRAEYYKDANQRIIYTYTKYGFQTLGASSNFDYSITDNVQVRFEAKMYQSKDEIFDHSTNNKNFALTTNLTLKL
jgi:Putative beta-barrel porin-2, OmpL-like. bbp2